MSAIATLVISNLQSPALYAEGFVAEAFADSGHTIKVSSASCGAVQTFSLIGSTTVTQASVTPNVAPQSVQVASLVLGGTTLAAGMSLIVGTGTSQELVEIVTTSVSGGLSYVNAVFMQTHLSGETIGLLTSLMEPNGVWVQAQLLVLSGLTAGTTYYLAAGVVSPGGAVNWSYLTATVAAAGTSFIGTATQDGSGGISYALYGSSLPGGLTGFDVVTVTNAVMPSSGTTPTWSGNPSPIVIPLTGLTSATTNVFIRANTASVTGPWIFIDQTKLGAAGSSNLFGAVPVLDNLRPYVSGMDSTFPPANSIYNPSFESGNEGWTLGTNWSMGQGHTCFGSWAAYIAGSLASPLTTASSITNNYQMPATPGTAYFAQCMIDGSSATGAYYDGTPSTSSYASVTLAFFNGSGVQIGSTYNGNLVLFGGGSWNLSRVVQVAPSGASYAIVGCVSNNQETGTVFVDDFAANAVPPAPVNVPDGPVYVKLANVGADHNIHISTALNPQGSILPNQPVPFTYSYTGTQVTVTANPTTLLRADGSLFKVVGGSVTFTGLTGTTSYYLYPYIRVSDGTLQFSNPSPPSTSPSMSQAMQAQSDGCLGMGVLHFTTTVVSTVVTGLGVTLPTTYGTNLSPSVDVSISGDGTGAAATVGWDSVYDPVADVFDFSPIVTITGGTGYSYATATITIANDFNCPNYSPGTSVITSTCVVGAGGGSGGSTTCPEADELVDVQTRGRIRVGDVVAGDMIKGRSFHTNEDIYRRVIQTSAVVAASWWIVNGYKCSPAEAVYFNNVWTPAFRCTGAKFDTSRGSKVSLSVESDEYNEQNYYLVKGTTPLLIHNQLINSC